MPEVSVIIPSHNCAHFLKEALDSVFSQTYKDYEVIVIDDGSTDETKGVVSQLGRAIRYICQERKGPAGARNTGIRTAAGRYVAFLDADDLWLPTKLERQMDLFKKQPNLAMVFANGCRFNQERSYPIKFDRKKYLLKGNIARNIFLYDGVGTPTVIVKKAVLDKIGFFDEELSIGEDDNMWVRIASEFEVGFVDEILAKFRDHDQNVTRDQAKLLEMVQLNIQLLLSRYVVAGERIRSAVPRKMAGVQFDLGYLHFIEGNLIEARRAFAQGIRDYGWIWKNYQYLMASYLPITVIEMIRSLKRAMSKRDLTNEIRLS